MNNKFFFRFNTILTVKQKIEEDKKTQLGLKIEKFQNEKEHLSSLVDKKKLIEKELNKKVQQKLRIKELQSINQNMQFLQQLIDQQKDKVDYCSHEVEKKRTELIDATKNKKAFEKLQEKDYEAFTYEQGKQEEMLVDQLMAYKVAIR